MQIDFHYLGTPDKLTYACRLLRKAVGKTQHIVVTGAAEQLAALDAMLWQFSASDFMGHHWLQQPAADTTPAYVMQCARIWLTATPLQCERRNLLLNLSDSTVAGFEQYQRLIELVATGEAEHAKAQNRWLYYTERNHTMARHNIHTHD